MILALGLQGVSAQKSDNFIHAAYSMSGSLKDVNYVRKVNFGQFQYHYIMAAPAWKAEDFDLSQEEINKKYVTDHAYGKEKKAGGLVPEYIKNIHKAGSKVMVSFPGKEFIDIAKSASRRDKFAVMMAAFVQKYGYDGIELDWEHTINLNMHCEFVKKIRQELDKLPQTKRYYVTTALHSYQRYSQELAREVIKYVDWINIMTYDMGGGIWGAVPTHNTPLAEMKSTLKIWDVFPKDRLCIGLASYGFYYKGLNPGEKVAKGNLGDYGRYCDYKELPALQQAGWVEKWDATQEAPYYYSPDGKEFMTLDSHRSLKAKIDWVVEQGFRGVFWWEFYCDYTLPEKGQKYGSHLLMDYVSTLVDPLIDKKK